LIENSVIFDEILNLWSHMFVIDLLRYFLGVGVVLFLLFIFKRSLKNRKIQSQHASIKQRGRELYYSVLTVLIYATIGIATFTGMQYGIFKIYHQVDDYPTYWLYFSVPLLALVHDTYFYWVHRFLHLKKIFKHGHRVHHLSRIPTPWTAYSFSPFEAVLMAFFVPFYSFIFPVHDLSLLAYLTFMIIRNAAGHSGYEFFPKGFTKSKLGWNTSHTHHDLHHQSFNFNYALYFTWWDRWMGTEHPQYHEVFDQVTNREPEVEPVASLKAS